MTGSRIIAFAIVGTIGLVAGYALGGFRDTASPKEEADSGTTVTAISHNGYAAPPPEFAAINRGGSGSAHVFLTATLRDIHDPDRIRYLLERTNQLPADISQASARAILLHNWLQSDANAAADWTAVNAPRHLDVLVKTWAAENLDGARTAIALGAPEAYAGSLSSAVLAEVARTDPDQALTIAIELCPLIPRSDHYRLQEAFLEIARIDPTAVLDPDLSIPNWMRISLRTSAASAMAEQKPAAALDWWQEQPDREALTSATFHKLPPGAWRSALDVLHQLEANSSKPTTTLESVINQAHYRWAQNDPARFFSLFGEAMHDERWSSSARNAFQNGLQHALAHHSDAAEEWLTGVTDPATQSFAQDTLDRIEEPSNDDATPPTVEDFVATPDRIDYESYNKLSPEERERFVNSLANTPEAFVEVLSELTSYGRRIPMDGVLNLLSVAPTEGEVVTEIARSLSRITASYAYANPAEAARWTESLPRGVILVSSVSSAATAWSTYDPAAARAWAESLPDPSARAAAIEAIDNQQ